MRKWYPRIPTISNSKSTSHLLFISRQGSAATISEKRLYCSNNGPYCFFLDEIKVHINSAKSDLFPFGQRLKVISVGAKAIPSTHVLSVGYCISVFFFLVQNTLKT